MTTTTDLLNSATFGIEIECFLPAGATKDEAARAVSERLGRTVQNAAYGHATSSNWRIVPDGSLGDYNRGCEFVSPILTGDAGLAQVETVCEALTDFGCTVNKQCGLHIHIGAANQPLDFFKRLTRLYGLYEPVIDSIMPPSRRASNNMFCRTMTAVSAISIERATSVPELASRIASSDGRSETRYRKLNLAAYNRHQTVEFRQHSGTLDATKASTWVRICLSMVAAAKRADLNLGTVSRAQANTARRGSKNWRIAEMMLRPEGVTGPEVCAAMGWPSVSMPQQARAAGIEYTTQRTGRTVRYFARVAAAETTPAAPITIDGFATLVGLADADRDYMRRRARNLGGPVAWAA